MGAPGTSAWGMHCCRDTAMPGARGRVQLARSPEGPRLALGVPTGGTRTPAGISMVSYGREEQLLLLQRLQAAIWKI